MGGGGGLGGLKSGSPFWVQALYPWGRVTGRPLASPVNCKFPYSARQGLFSCPSLLLREQTIARRLKLNHRDMSHSSHPIGGMCGAARLGIMASGTAPWPGLGSCIAQMDSKCPQG